MKLTKNSLETIIRCNIFITADDNLMIKTLYVFEAILEETLFLDYDENCLEDY